MEDKDLIALTETVERTKSNTHQIGEIKNEIKEMRTEQKAIYELTSSVKMIAQDMSSIKESVEDVKQGQKSLEVQMDTQISEVKGKIALVDSKSKVDFLEIMRVKLIPFLFGGGCIYGVIELIKYLAK
jgi:uncharacterized protein YhaN